MIVYGGTFNPVHNGHIQIAKHVEELYKEPVIFIPAYDSPWKPELKDTFEDRCNMLKLANVKYFIIEQELPTPSYTYQTINELYDGERIKFIIGTDQFKVLYGWKHSEILKEKCEFLVIKRNLDMLPELCEDDKFLNFLKDCKFTIIPMDPIDVSSTQVRNGRLDLVPEPVKEYILKNSLY